MYIAIVLSKSINHRKNSRKRLESKSQRCSKEALLGKALKCHSTMTLIWYSTQNVSPVGFTPIFS
jgi:hypothetical protein